MFSNIASAILKVAITLEDLEFRDPWFWVFVMVTVGLIILNGYWFLFKTRRTTANL